VILPDGAAVGTRCGGAARWQPARPLRHISSVSAWISLARAVGVIALLAILWTRLRRTRGRRGAALAPFLRHFDAQQIPDDVALAIYHHLEHWMEDSQRGFAVAPRDDLSIYGIGAEDVDETLDLLLAACGRRRDENAPRGALATVEDLVRYVASCPPAASGAEAQPRLR
jgi:hypothetical protein